MKNDFILLFLALWPITGALISYLIGRKNKKARDFFAMFVCILEFALIGYMFIQVANGAEYVFRMGEVCGRGLYLKMDGFRAVYSGIAALMWMMTTILSREYFAHYRNRNRYYFFLLVTFGATVGVFLSADLFTTFIFFELMSMASYVMVIHDEKPAAMRAGDTYITVAVLGGMVMLMGIFLLYNAVGTLDMDLLLEACEHYENKGILYIAAILMLFGFGAKAGMFPLHIWLPKAHPVAPAPASALLSGILTKTGVFGILVIGSYIFLHDQKWGFLILCIGVITMFLGAVLAVFSIDLKRTLACSSMSQIGFILTGAGMQGLLGHHNALAVRGTLLHMVNHSMLKLVLFMAAGVVYMNLHKLDLNEIRGFGRKKPLLNFCFLMGVLGIIGMPMWNGYISKTLIHESIVEFIWLFENYTFWARFFQVVEGIFLFSGGLTAAYMTKLYIAIFVEKNPYKQEKMDASNGKYMNLLSTFALVGSAVLLPMMGMLPYKIMNGIADLGQGFMFGHEPAHAVDYFSWTNIKGGLASLAIGAIVYIFIIRICLMDKDENGNRVYVDIWPDWIDLEDAIYRPLLMDVLPAIGAFFARIGDVLVDLVFFLGGQTVTTQEAVPHTFKEFAFMKEKTKASSIQRQISTSLSFSLLLFCIGLVCSLVYLLFVVL
ncbi:MAG: NADH dehydrogenase [Erysipelotrichales bacterium]|nr:NADH dehydrogenase [Erysipelotrichales bacterium]